MALTLSAVRRVGDDKSAAAHTPLTADRYTIGRGQDCDIVLDDPARRTSRVHATLARNGDVYVLTVDSRVNPVLVNQNSYNQGQTVTLAAGDEIVIADFVLTVLAADGAANAGAAPAPQPVAPLMWESAASGQAPRSDLDALLNLPATPVARPQPAAASIDDLIGSSAPSRIDDPLLGILNGRAAPASLPRESAAPSDDPLMQLLGTTQAIETGASTPPVGAGTSIDQLLGPGSSSGDDPLGLGLPKHNNPRQGFGGGRGGSLELDHVHDVNLPFAPPQARAAAPAAAFVPPPAAPFAPPPAAAPLQPPPAPSSDPLAALLGEVSPSRPVVSQSDDPLAFLNEPASPPAAAMSRPAPIVSPPPPLQPAPVASPPPTMQPAPAYAIAGISQAQAVRAFLQGASIEHVQVSEAQAEAFMRECGAVCRAAVEGIMGLLLARATVKEQLGAVDRTMLSARENNPLKMIGDVQEAISFVFDPRSRSPAFLAPDKAVTEACNDLKVHEIALMAGMRAALMSAVHRFDPVAIEKKLAGAGGASLLVGKKAKLWDALVAQYDATSLDVEDNFDRVFGTDFLKAYQEQIKRLKH